MRLPSFFDRKAYWVGPFAAVYAWVVILTSAALNPDWSVTSQALSYLGAGTAHDPWMYSYVGMVPTGILLAIFSIYLAHIARNTPERMGSWMFLLAGFLLVGIGLFHQGPGWYPVGTASDGQNLHDLFSAWFFLQLFLTVILWGWGLFKEHQAPLGLGMVALALGSLAVAGILLRAFGKIPGGSGEVLGVLAIDVWVGMMFFAKDSPPFHFSVQPWQGQLDPDEKPVLQARRSLLYAFQVPAMALVLLGMFLFFYGGYYLVGQLANVINGSTKVAQIVGPVLTLYIVGFLLVVLGAWRWSVALPRWAGSLLWGTVVAVPLVMVGSWFDTAGDLAMLDFFLVFALLLPLAISLLAWWRTRYLLTDRRVLQGPGLLQGDADELGRPRVGTVVWRKGWFHRWFNVGSIVFLPKEGEDGPRTGLLSSGGVEWAGVANPSSLVPATERELQLQSVRARRKLRPSLFLAGVAIAVPLVLVVTAVPVFSATSTLNMPCAFLLGDLSKVLDDPWPYLHNDTLPLGQVSFRWWSGTDVLLLVGQLPTGHLYESVQVSTSASTLPSDLTSSGTGGFTSYGGDSFAGCISLSDGASVTLVYSYGAPLIWS